MKFTPIDMHDTVMAFKVNDGVKDLGQVWMRDLYWHGRKEGKDIVVSGGPGFERGRGYEDRNAAARALTR